MGNKDDVFLVLVVECSFYSSLLYRIGSECIDAGALKAPLSTYP